MTPEAVIGNSDEILFRQIRPLWLSDDGTPSSQNFQPMPKDKGQLSLDRASIATPQGSFNLFTQSPPDGFGGDSCAVFGVSAGECRAQSLVPKPDPLKADPPFPENPAHALADFNGLDNSKWKKVARKLRDLAMDRGKLWPPKQLGSDAGAATNS